MRRIDQTHDGTAIELPVGTCVELVLDENPSTGFRWDVVADGGPALTWLRDDFEARVGPPGTGGLHRWQIRVERPGPARVELVSRRRGQHDQPAGWFRVTLQGRT